MLVKIISGTYGHRPILPNGQKSHYVIPVKAGETIDVEGTEGERLIGLGVAEAATPEKSEAPKATPVDEPAEAVSDDYDSKSLSELKEIARAMGIETGNIKSKAKMIEALRGADDIPSFDAEDVVD